MLTKVQSLALLEAFQYWWSWPGSELLLAPGIDEAGRPAILVTPVTAPELDANTDGPEMVKYLRALYFND